MVNAIFLLAERVPGSVRGWSITQMQKQRMKT